MDSPESDTAAIDADERCDNAVDELAAAPAASDDDTTSAGDAFARLGLHPAVADAVAELGYEHPTPVQAECIPWLLAGRDLLGQAQTGTGKTAAFALPLLSRLDPTLSVTQVLVLAPTRELALQVAEAFQQYGRRLPGFHVVPIYGGQSYTLQIRQLNRHPQVIVGTPGRVMDHMRRGTLSLAALRTLVLDEADEMLSMGFAEDIDWIFEHTPAERQVALFSATMPDAVRGLARARLREPAEVQVRSAAATVDTIEQQHCIVTRDHKLDVLTRFLELEPFDGMVIFVRTKLATIELADKLKAHGFAAEALNGDMTQDLRERTVEGLKRGVLDIVVATDVAARGLDVERVSHVVNYDIPNDPQAYIHRVGRTGRAGRNGRAILLVEPRERGLLRAIERVIRRQVPQIDPPSAAELSSSRIDRFTAELRKTLTEQDLGFFHELVARIVHEQELDPLAIAAALTYQLQRGRPLEVAELPRPARRTDRPNDRRNERRPYDDREPRPRRQMQRDDAPPPRAPAADFRDRSDTRDFGDSAARPDRPPRQRREDTPGLVAYRIAVGHEHGVTPREIVGAIANEAGLEGRYIGRIDIRDDHSVVELPEGMPREILQHMKRVFVRGQALRMTAFEGGGRGGWSPDGAPPRRPRPQPGDDFGNDGGDRPRRFRDDDRRPSPRGAQGDERPRRFTPDDNAQARPRRSFGDESGDRRPPRFRDDNRGPGPRGDGGDDRPRRFAPDDGRPARARRDSGDERPRRYRDDAGSDARPRRETPGGYRPASSGAPRSGAPRRDGPAPRRPGGRKPRD